MQTFFPEIRKNFGFGMMRLPMVGDEVDMPQVCDMVDAFLAAGFNYFDTAHPYIQGKSEQAIRQCLTSRYPRERYLLANKLSGSDFDREEQILPLFETKLAACGVEYFDFYLMHAMNAKRHALYTQLRAYDIAQELKAQGRVRHVGISFHDSAEVLDRILTDRPELEFVQLQFNYADWSDPRVQAGLCWEVCRKHGKPVMVMEPVRGGSLVNLPPEALEMMTGGSPASYAIRYCAGFENVVMVLSGMSNMAQMQDNLATMQSFVPLSGAEHQLIDRVRTLFQAQGHIPCTACRYCTDGCPAGIDIPQVFACVNERGKEGSDAQARYAAMAVGADACLRCGLCEGVCPQHLHIRQLLESAARTFGA